MPLNTTTLHRLLRYTIGALLILAFMARIMEFVFTFLLQAPISEWQFSEFFINYEGGFVRRGLIGQGLMSLARSGLSGDAIINLIRVVSIGCYMAVFAFFIYKFHQRRWNWWIILAPVFMGFVMCVIRKDFMQALMLIGILMLLRGSPHAGGRLSLWCVTALCVLELLIHEAFTFWGIPITVLLIASLQVSRWEKASAIAVIAATIIVIGCFKGNEQMAHVITDSWLPILPQLEYGYWNSVGAIGWNPGWAAYFHCITNFFSPEIGWLRLPLQIAAFTCYAYMVCNFVYAFSPAGETRETYRKHLTSVYILTSITMIPMFTVLSVDYSRLYQYLTITSFATVLVIPAACLDRALPGVLLRLTGRITLCIDRYFTPSKGIMVALLFLSDVNGIHLLNNISVGTLSSLWNGIMTLVWLIRG